MNLQLQQPLLQRLPKNQILLVKLSLEMRVPTKRKRRRSKSERRRKQRRIPQKKSKGLLQKLRLKAGEKSVLSALNALSTEVVIVVTEVATTTAVNAVNIVGETEEAIEEATAEETGEATIPLILTTRSPSPTNQKLLPRRLLPRKRLPPQTQILLPPWKISR